jgi:hypothetical protein
MLLLQVSEKCMAYSEKASLYRLLNANTIELLSVTDASSDSDIDTIPTQTRLRHRHKNCGVLNNYYQ